MIGRSRSRTFGRLDHDVEGEDEASRFASPIIRLWVAYTVPRSMQVINTTSWGSTFLRRYEPSFQMIIHYRFRAKCYLQTCRTVSAEIPPIPTLPLLPNFSRFQRSHLLSLFLLCYRNYTLEITVIVEALMVNDMTNLEKHIALAFIRLLCVQAPKITAALQFMITRALSE